MQPPAPTFATAASARNFKLGLAPFTYADLYAPDALKSLSHAFDAVMAAADPSLAAHLAAWRGGQNLSAPAESALLVAVAQHIGPFVAQLFAVGPHVQALKEQINRHKVIFAFKRDFVHKRVRRHKAAAPVNAQAYAALEAQLGGEGDAELRAARCAMALLELYQRADHRPAPTPEDLAKVAQQTERLIGAPVAPAAAKAVLADLLAMVEAWHAPRLAHTPWVSYQQPLPLDVTHQNLVPLQRPQAELPESLRSPDASLRERDGFALTDRRMAPRQIDNEIDYCLVCHPRGKDSCRHGLYDKQGEMKHSALGTPLTGCPLNERVSEAHLLRGQGDVIAALAMVTVDNPMCAGTGHRICNDCMKACIFQKQEPVNIPQVETGILTDVLALPFGFEIYSLLTRFNPLHRIRPYPLPYNGHNILVVGLGPAGYTLSHYLVNEGFGVVGIDGLKIEPLPADLTGADAWPPRALRNFQEIEEALDRRILGGFGGVAEYGITVRWDKNFLKVIYLMLARQQKFAFFGGIRFGGTLSVDDAWAQGFHHVAIAAGAGRPTVIDIKNNMLRGMRAASDFLMGLQLTGAFKHDSMANLQIELPAVVVGGGLTAVDTATEVAAYYPVQVKKLFERVQTLGEATVLACCDAEEREILQRMLGHARELLAEQQKPQPNVAALVQRWGGVSVAYRRGFTDSPAYRLNHEEVQKALEEGIGFIEYMTPTQAVADAYGHVSALRCRRQDGTYTDLPARAVMVAAGTAPNTIYEREIPGTFKLDGRGKFFAPFRLDWQQGGDPVLVPAKAADRDAFFTSYTGGARRYVSYYGDNHPRYAGNVVRAMASAKDGFVHVARLFRDVQPCDNVEAAWTQLTVQLRDRWVPRIERVQRLTPTIVEVVVRAPAQVEKFAPGQFFRLQNYEATSPQAGAMRLTMEGLALTGAWVDTKAGLLGMVALEMGVSSRLCSMLRPGEEVVLMGPTGAPTEIPTGETVILCGGGLGNAVLFSVARALKAHGNRVLYFAGYRHADDVYKQEEVESKSDQVVWSVEHGKPITPRRPQDRSFVGNIVQAMQAYAHGAIADPLVAFAQVDRILAIGSDRMMAAVTTARKTVLAEHLSPHHQAIASINSPMQCMMKEVCAQCLQRHVDPISGEESFVFTCFNQDQPQDTTDWQHLAARLRQNTVLEKVTNLYLDRVLQNDAA